MKIAILSPPYLPVPPIGYGGTERIVYYLAEGLVKKGHEVTLFASGDSKTSAKLSATFEKSLGNSGELKGKTLLPLIQYADCYSRANDFDIIHNHAQFLGLFFADFVNTPVVHTMHCTLYNDETTEEKIRTVTRFKNHKYISISNNQREGQKELNWIDTVYNGIDLNEYEFNQNKGEYLLWLGRITEKKGPVEAIETAKKIGIPLKMAAAIDPIDRPFYEEKVKPLIDGKFISFLGELHGNEKSKLYASALATLYPISWHEPFGLVMAESMATGTPVIAYNIGSVSEIVRDGVTGFIINQQDKSVDLRIQSVGIEGLVEGVKRIGEINRNDCRKWVEDNFTIEKMVDGYEKVYKNVISRQGVSI